MKSTKKTLKNLMQQQKNSIITHDIRAGFKFMSSSATTDKKCLNCEEAIT